MNAETYHDIKGLLKGEECTFEIEANCGAPSFKINTDKSNLDLNKIGISFVEYNDRKYNWWRDFPKTLYKTDPGAQMNFNPNITLRYNETYREGMPPRNLSIEESGEQGFYSAQMKPRRIFSNGLYKPA